MLRTRGVAWGGGALAISLALSALDGQATGFGGWFGYLIAAGVGAAVLELSWRQVASLGPPRWLLLGAVLAVLLRLGAGVALWRALPIYGYDENHNRAGYLFPDAHNRDKDAIALARSSKPLWTAVSDPSVSDQYGGLLYLSAASYRYLTPQGHYPLLLVLFSSTAAGATVLFVWGFTRMAFGAGAAPLAAGIAAVYPDSILLGASQMREPFILAGAALSFLGYARYRESGPPQGQAAMVIGVLLTLAFSPPFGLLLVVLLLGAAAWEGHLVLGRRPVLFLMLAAAGIAGLYVVFDVWGALVFGANVTLADAFSWWFGEGTRFELYKLARDSGWADKLFELTPAWMHAPLAALNGLVQPFLPAALMDWTGTPLFRGLITVRALGWFLLLPFLVYTPLAALRAQGPRSLLVYLAAVVWVGAFLIAFRTAGDQWDNPRYRVFLLAFQAALAGWAWAHARRLASPWLGRAAVVVAFATLAFIQWYGVRYYHFPGLDLWATLALIAVFSPVYLAVTWWLDARRGGGGLRFGER